MKLPKTKWQLIALIIVVLAIAYGAASLAIDRGNWLFYIATFGLLWLGLRIFKQLFKKP